MILLFTVFSITVSNSQIQKGSYLLDLDLSANFSNRENSISSYSNSNLSIGPSAGLFLSEKAMFQVGLFYNINMNEYIHGETVSEGQNYQLGGFLGYTRYISMSDKLYLNLGGTVGAGYSYDEIVETHSGITVVDAQSEYLLLNFNLRPGISYFINPRWIIGANIGRLFYSIETNSEETYQNAGFSFSGNTFGVSFSYVIGANRE